MRVKLTAGLVPDYPQSLLNREPAPVGPVAGERLKDISQGYQTAEERDLFPGQAQRIALAIPLFMMMQDNFLFFRDQI